MIRSGEMMRAFFCIPLSQTARDTVSAVATQLRRETDMRASWVRPENYHLTVRFLGEIDPRQTIDLGRIAEEAARRHASFRLSLSRVGAFPSFSRPRVLWMGDDAPSAFTELVGDVNDGLGALGFPPERKATVAHVTVARIKGRSDPTLDEKARLLRPSDPESVDVGRIILMESRLGPGGATYTPLYEVSLSGGS